MLLFDKGDLEFLELKDFVLRGPILVTFFLKLVPFILLFTAEHNDVVDILVPHRPPEVDRGVLGGALGGDEEFLIFRLVISVNVVPVDIALGFFLVNVWRQLDN